MKSDLEQTYAAKRLSAEALVRAEHPDLIEMVPSFSNLECFIDVRLEAGWQRYELIESAEDEPHKIERIG